MIFFDLPTTSVDDRKNYARFRKDLINEGFIMMQFSIYTKLVLNPESVRLTKERLVKIMPKDGDVQLLTVTEKQYANIEYFCKKPENNAIQSTDRTIFL